MLKKTLIVGAAAFLLLALFFGRDACSYIGTSVGWIRQSVKDSVPIEFELERARKMVRELDQPITAAMRVTAKEEVEVDRLEREVTKRESNLATARDRIMRLKNDLDSGTGTFVYAGHTYSERQVRNDLAARFDRFKTDEDTTLNLTKVLNARRQGLDAAREKLVAMQAAKKQLELDVANLEARLKMVEVAQASSDLRIDDSQLARTKDLITDISTRIEVAEKLVNADVQVAGEIPLDEPETDTDISQRVADYFGQGREEVEILVGAR